MGKWQRIQFQPGVGIGPEGSRVTCLLYTSDAADEL